MMEIELIQEAGTILLGFGNDVKKHGRTGITRSYHRDEEWEHVE